MQEEANQRFEAHDLFDHSIAIGKRVAIGPARWTLAHGAVKLRLRAHNESTVVEATLFTHTQAKGMYCAECAATHLHFGQGMWIVRHESEEPSEQCQNKTIRQQTVGQETRTYNRNALDGCAGRVRARNEEVLHELADVLVRVVGRAIGLVLFRVSVHTAESGTKSQQNEHGTQHKANLAMSMRSSRSRALSLSSVLS